jgi:hypothetical protein
MTNIEAIVTERDNLIQLIGELRTALHTPADADIVTHAAATAAKAAKWDKVNEMTIDEVAAMVHKAAKWDAVPWETIDDALFFHYRGYNMDEAMNALQEWHDANKPAGDA